jgi:hypothetical protein
MGNSSRPHFRVHAKDPVGKIDEAEAFFIDALEEWRKEKKIEKMTLLVCPPFTPGTNSRVIPLAAISV